MELRRLNDVHCDRYVVSIDQIEYGNTVAITYDDTTVVFYDSQTMNAYSGMEDVHTVTSLAQAGFRCPQDPSGSLALTRPIHEQH